VTLFDQSIAEGETPKFSRGQQRDLKEKIYDVCKLIYEEQRIAGAQLQQIERKVCQLRANFTELMVKSKGYATSYEEVEALFSFKNDSSRIHSEVLTKIKEIKNRNVSSQLESQLKKLQLVGDKKNEGDKAKSKDEPAKTIKEGLEKGAYNPLIASKSSSGSLLKRGGAQTQFD